ncbi:2'-5'-oligoadenylate synthase 1A-like [Chionomys nivalis]|uniref:2'-5'-oligoadenylate synthase 1A-like n=1 Tax=Chionomys nivalis TaxID=269649 RepID=UPI0025922B0D|nr:2'-5'-oligoadenylate synthase 1A-like [Chionomys nivalis]
MSEINLPIFVQLVFAKLDQIAQRDLKRRWPRGPHKNPRPSHLWLANRGTDASRRLIPPPTPFPSERVRMGSNTAGKGHLRLYRQLLIAGLRGAACRPTNVAQCKEKLRKPLPPQYALELFTVYAWKHRFTEFNIAQGFRTVLELVTKHRELQIYWTMYYDFQDQDISNYLHRQLTRARPVILDPADPTSNVAGSNPAGWWLLAEEAVAWLDYSCVKNRAMSPVRSWAVSVDKNWN